MSGVLPLAIGFVFGILLNRARVTDCHVIEGQFRLTDFTMIKVMLPAIVVGGLGVLTLVQLGAAQYHIKDANLLSVGLGAAIFGVALVFYGYCPGTGLAALATGSLHAFAGVLGMIAGAMFYAFSYAWIKSHISGVWAFGKVRLPELTGVSDIVWLGGLGLVALVAFVCIERRVAAA